MSLPYRQTCDMKIIRRFGKARIFVDGVELLVKRYSFLQQARRPCFNSSGQSPDALLEERRFACPVL